jgi:LacI family transcriptional regulator
MAKHKSATMKDIAARADVSVATVSRVINDNPSVKPHIRKAVEAAIKELDYPLRSNSTGQKQDLQKIGLVIPDITNPYFPLLIKGITNIAKVHGAEIVLCNSDNDIRTEEYHFKMLLNNGVDGIIYIPFSESINPVFRDIVKAGFPLVFLDREVSIANICSVTSNNEEGAYQATTYLLNLGHRDIIFISGPPHFSTSITRKAGYKRGLAEFGIEYVEDMILYGDTTLDSAYQATKKVISDGVHFTAIFASNDLMAFGAWNALEDNGFKVPDDVSIIGYDDVPLSSFISLTTIAQPSIEIGRNALILLMDLINKRREPPQNIVLRDSLIIRKSCKKT